MRRLDSSSGITYIQVLFIVVLAGVVSALYVPYLTSQHIEEVRQDALSRMERIALAEEAWYGMHGRFIENRDSLATVLADTTDFYNPQSGERFVIGTANNGQDYSISTRGEEPLILVTEDRWNQFLEAYKVWQAESTRRLQEESARDRRGRRPPPR